MESNPKQGIESGYVSEFHMSTVDGTLAKGAHGAETQNRPRLIRCRSFGHSSFAHQQTTYRWAEIGYLAFAKTAANTRSIGGDFSPDAARF
nr:hypothetical protein [Mesorhizobium sp. L2C054A000]